MVEHRQQVPNWFPVDHAREAFEAAYPFHPMTLSVFERKWQALPRFPADPRRAAAARSVGVARLRGRVQGAHRDPLVGMGTAPLDDSLFRSAVFEQLGETRLEGAVTTDVCGKKESHAVRLDKEAEEVIKKARLHRKVATVIFFESNGGQAKAEATVPEIRLAVAEPDLDVGHVDAVLEALSACSYYLTSERNRYRFSLSPNLNKLLADRRASVHAAEDRRAAAGRGAEGLRAGSGAGTNLLPREEQPDSGSGRADIRGVGPRAVDGRREEDAPVRGGRDTGTRLLGPDVQERAGLVRAGQRAGPCTTKPASCSPGRTSRTKKTNSGLTTAKNVS